MATEVVVLFDTGKEAQGILEVFRERYHPDSYQVVVVTTRPEEWEGSDGVTVYPYSAEREPDQVDLLVARLREGPRVAAILPTTYGVAPFDEVAVAIIAERLGLSWTPSGSVSITQDKAEFAAFLASARQLRRHGLRIPRQVVCSADATASITEDICGAARRVGRGRLGLLRSPRPAVVKPGRGGFGSLGVETLDPAAGPADQAAAVGRHLARRNVLGARSSVVEEAIIGRTVREVGYHGGRYGTSGTRTPVTDEAVRRPGGSLWRSPRRARRGPSAAGSAGSRAATGRLGGGVFHHAVTGKLLNSHNKELAHFTDDRDEQLQVAAPSLFRLMESIMELLEVNGPVNADVLLAPSLIGNLRWRVRSLLARALRVRAVRPPRLKRIFVVDLQCRPGGRALGELIEATHGVPYRASLISAALGCPEPFAHLFPARSGIAGLGCLASGMVVAGPSERDLRLLDQAAATESGRKRIHHLDDVRMPYPRPLPELTDYLAVGDRPYVITSGRDLGEAFGAFQSALAVLWIVILRADGRLTGIDRTAGAWITPPLPARTQAQLIEELERAPTLFRDLNYFAAAILRQVPTVVADAVGRKYPEVPRSLVLELIAILNQRQFHHVAIPDSSGAVSAPAAVLAGAARSSPARPIRFFSGRRGLPGWSARRVGDDATHQNRITRRPRARSAFGALSLIAQVLGPLLIAVAALTRWPLSLKLLLSGLAVFTGILVKVDGMPHQIRQLLRARDNHNLSIRLNLESWWSYATITLYGLVTGDFTVVASQGLGVIFQGIICVLIITRRPARGLRATRRWSLHRVSDQGCAGCQTVAARHPANRARWPAPCVRCGPGQAHLVAIESLGTSGSAVLSLRCDHCKARDRHVAFPWLAVEQASE